MSLTYLDHPQSLQATEAIRHYLTQSLSLNTRKAYQADLEHYRSWGGVIPASPEQIASYLSCHAETLAIATMQRRLVSIGKAHSVGGYTNPVKSELVRLTFRGIRRVHSKAQRQVKPILTQDVIMMISSLPLTVQGKRDAALVLLAFSGAFRRSELSNLNCSDVSFTSEGMIVRLRRSKTDQLGHTREIAVPASNARICPVRSVLQWMETINSQGKLFRSVNRGGVPGETITDHAIARIIKRLIKSIGYDPTDYSGHSTRSGFATSAAQAGKSSWSIRRQTGHKSDQMLNRYIRQGNLFKDNASALF